MKKNMVRILAFVLVLILALGIIPMGTLAVDVNVTELVFNRIDPTVYGFITGSHLVSSSPYNTTFYTEGTTISASDYSAHHYIDGKLYDFQGFSADIGAADKKISEYMEKENLSWDNPDDASKISAYIESVYKNTNTSISFSKQDIKIDPFPTTGTPEDQTAWYNKYYYIFIAGYTPHQHRLSYWYADDTTHWRECLVCKKFANQGFWEQFMYQNWHSDGDEDRVCDVCGHDIPYHEVEVIDSKGGKITVNLDEAPHRKKITATVEVEDGYKLKKLHFTKVRTDGSKQEITRYKKNGEFYTLMPTYDLEVTAEYVKTK